MVRNLAHSGGKSEPEFHFCFFGKDIALTTALALAVADPRPCIQHSRRLGPSRPFNLFFFFGRSGDTPLAFTSIATYIRIQTQSFVLMTAMSPSPPPKPNHGHGLLSGYLVKSAFFDVFHLIDLSWCV